MTGNCALAGGISKTSLYSLALVVSDPASEVLVERHRAKEEMAAAAKAAQDEARNSKTLKKAAPVEAPVKKDEQKPLSPQRCLVFSIMWERVWHEVGDINQSRHFPLELIPGIKGLLVQSYSAEFAHSSPVRPKN